MLLRTTAQCSRAPVVLLVNVNPADTHFLCLDVSVYNLNGVTQTQKHLNICLESVPLLKFSFLDEQIQSH